MRNWSSFFLLRKKKKKLGKLDQNDINLYLYFTFLVFSLTWKLKQNTSVQHYNGCKIRHAVNLDLDRDMAALHVGSCGGMTRSWCWWGESPMWLDSTRLLNPSINLEPGKLSNKSVTTSKVALGFLSRGQGGGSECEIGWSAKFWSFMCWNDDVAVVV